MQMYVPKSAMIHLLSNRVYALVYVELMADYDVERGQS